MKKMIKRIAFAVIIVLLVLATGMVIKTGKFEKLEGYMYSFAAEITNSVINSSTISSKIISNNTQDTTTSSNIISNNTQDSTTSSNIISNNTQDSTTSSNATSSNAQNCATSSNATSSNAQNCATSSNATSSNAQITETIKVTNTQTDTNPNTQNNTEQEGIEKELIYNNSEITQEILENISNSTETQSITINLDNDANISEDIFEAIKGKEIKLTINVGENKIIFNGNDITTPKDINVEISYNIASKDTLLKEIVEEGVVINFANNGVLPGIATIRIKVTDEIKQALNMETILVYYYNETTKELIQMTNNAKLKKDEFIEFSINHNSKYLLVNEPIEEKEYTITTQENYIEKNEVSFLESHKMYIMIIGVSVLAIVVVTIILVIDKKAIAKRKSKANNNEEKID